MSKFKLRLTLSFLMVFVFLTERGASSKIAANHLIERMKKILAE